MSQRMSVDISFGFFLEHPRKNVRRYVRKNVRKGVRRDVRKYARRFVRKNIINTRSRASSRNPRMAPPSEHGPTAPLRIELPRVLVHG